MSDDVVELPTEVDESQREAWQIWVAYGNDDDDSGERFLEAYRGSWSSLADYAEEFCSDCYDIPEWCEYYIDYEAMARDWQLSGDIWAEEDDYDNIHIFDGHI